MVFLYRLLTHLEQALFEALMRQEELLAYIDSQEEAKIRVCALTIPCTTLIHLHPNHFKSWDELSLSISD